MRGLFCLMFEGGQPPSLPMAKPPPEYFSPEKIGLGFSNFAGEGAETL